MYPEGKGRLLNLRVSLLLEG